MASPLSNGVFDNLVFWSRTCFMFRSVPYCVSREQLLSHVGVGRCQIPAVVVTIVLGVDVVCYVLVDGSPAARLLFLNLSPPSTCCRGVPHHQVLRARRFNRPHLFTECVILN